MMHNQLFHNYLWRLFAETPIHKEFSVKYALNKGKNVKVTGFPGTDVFLDKKYEPQNCWKHKNPDIKKLIWAPHHTIDNDTSFLSYSSFLVYSDFMLKLPSVFNGKIQIAFKPHPLLFNRLSEESFWGKERTISYYNSWENLEFGQLVDGDYVDLFLTSDAMMHDSGSFLIEYLYTGKPVLYLDRDDKITERMNDFGIQAFNQHYHAKNESDIENFILSVLHNKDIKKSDREKFLLTELLPPNHRSASENVLVELLSELDRNKS
jgi:CDP-glycerol glycerophosphotransferase (TagB/SpsB family)